MKLVLRRRQRDKKGMLGGHKGMLFVLYAKVELTPEENGLVTRYKAHGFSLGSYEAKASKLDSFKIEFNVTVGELLQGYETKEVPDVIELLGLEREIKNSCQNFKNLLMVIASFDGEEVIEY